MSWTRARASKIERERERKKERTKKREKRIRPRAEEVVELLEKRGEEKLRNEGRTTGKGSLIEDEEL